MTTGAGRERAAGGLTDDPGWVPVVQAFLFVGATWLAWWLLTRGVDVGDTRSASVESPGPVGAREWQVWTGVAALGQAGSVALLVLGWRRLLRVRRELAVPGAWVAVYAVGALAFVVCVALVTGELVSGRREWSLGDALQDRLAAVALVGLLCAAPWVAVVWVLYRQTRLTRRGSGSDPAQSGPTEPSGKSGQSGGGPVPSAPGRGERGRRALARASAELDAQTRLDDLQRVWRSLTATALAFATFVVIAMLPTGALRFLWLSQGTTRAERRALDAAFPSSDVLVYGALFGLIVLVLVLPLIFTWRAAAQALVDDIHPVSAATAADEAACAARERLEKMLNLDVALVRNPLTILSVLTPLVTATVAAFLPELAG